MISFGTEFDCLYIYPGKRKFWVVMMCGHIFRDRPFMCDKCWDSVDGKISERVEKVVEKNRRG